MEYTDIKNLSVKDLQNLLVEKREELRELRFKAGERQLKNFGVIGEVRRSIAKILTALRAKTVENKK